MIMYAKPAPLNWKSNHTHRVADRDPGLRRTISPSAFVAAGGGASTAGSQQHCTEGAEGVQCAGPGAVEKDGWTETISKALHLAVDEVRYMYRLLLLRCFLVKAIIRPDKLGTSTMEVDNKEASLSDAARAAIAPRSAAAVNSDVCGRCRSSYGRRAPAVAQCCGSSCGSGRPLAAPSSGSEPS